MFHTKVVMTRAQTRHLEAVLFELRNFWSALGADNKRIIDIGGENEIRRPLNEDGLAGLNKLKAY